MIKSISWTGNSLRIIDQTEIPAKLVFLDLNSSRDVYTAIQKLSVRGAPAIGVAAAFGLFLGLRDGHFSDIDSFYAALNDEIAFLKSARPTAVNLAWALEYIRDTLLQHDLSPSEAIEKTGLMAQAILKDDEERCEKMGTLGAGLIEDGARILTHCNTGALATAGIGTALGAIYKAHQHGKKVHVYVDETRPLLQGARLTMWELKQAGIPATLITDNMAAYAMQQNMIDLAIVGADRIAANGDVANKIGTYSVAVNCDYHNIPFYVAAPESTFDVSVSSGTGIPIEQRNPGEVSRIWNRVTVTVDDAQCWNPAFDITPAALIAGIITENEILRPPFLSAIENTIKKNPLSLKLEGV